MSEERFDFCLLPAPGRRSARIDQVISDETGICSRNQLKQRLVSLRINGEHAKLSRRVSGGERIELELETPPPLEITPEDIPLQILFENEDVIVINKPQGLVVHPAPGNYSGTLVHGLLFHQGLDTETEDFRPGIVHRLDKDTSGVLITAKNSTTHQFLARQFQERETGKEYLALCRGSFSETRGRISNRLGRSPRNRQRFTVVESGGREAETDYRLLRAWKEASLVALRPRTGRTHQLRVHMRHIGHPILGDPLYGAGAKDGCTLMLHAFRLTIRLPGEERPRTFRAPLEPRFADLFRGFNVRQRSR